MNPWWMAAAVFLLLVLIQVILKTPKPLGRAVTEIGVGLGALLLVNISGIFTGVTLPVSVLSVSVAAVAGVPGVTAMLLLNLIL